MALTANPVLKRYLEIFLLLLFSWAIPTNLYAKAYKCVINGKTIYSAIPCSPHAKKIKLRTSHFAREKIQNSYAIPRYSCSDILKLKDIGKMKMSKREKLAHTYGDLIKAKAKQLNKYSRRLRRPSEYMCPLNNLTFLALESENIASYRKSLLRDIRDEYPGVYPYLILYSQVSSPFVKAEQDKIVREVSSKKIIPFSISRFMKRTGYLFQFYAKKGDIGSAKHYIAAYKKYYGLSDKTAMDFAFIYNQIGDPDSSTRLLREYGKRSFKVSEFSINGIDSSYYFVGFDKKGGLKFKSQISKYIYISYHSQMGTYELGEIPVKWYLHFTNKTMSGNKNPEFPNSFAFGNRGEHRGKMVWTSLPVKAQNNAKKHINDLNNRSNN